MGCQGGARRWRLLAITLALIGLGVAGCARRSPHGVAERYLEGLRQFDYADCYSLLSEADRAARSLPEFLTEIPLAPDVSPVWFRAVLHQSQYALGEATRDGAAAVVPVRITTPDLPRWERALNQAAGAAGVSTEAVQQSLDRGTYPRRVYDDRIFLTKEHHHWRVVAGFAARDAIVDRHRQALNDYLAQRYDKAIPQWRAMIAELKAQRATGSPGLAELYEEELARLERLRAVAPAARAYGSRLKLSDLAMKMSEERTPAIFGTVRNAGDHPVDALRLAVTWYSGRGKDLRSVYREEHPIVVTPIEFTDFSRAVLPFAPGESRPFGFVLTAPAAVQQQASPYVTVSSLALAETQAPALLATPLSPAVAGSAATAAAGTSRSSPAPRANAGGAANPAAH